MKNATIDGKFEKQATCYCGNKNAIYMLVKIINLNSEK